MQTLKKVGGPEEDLKKSGASGPSDELKSAAQRAKDILEAAENQRREAEITALREEEERRKAKRIAERKAAERRSRSWCCGCC